MLSSPELLKAYVQIESSICFLFGNLFYLAPFLLVFITSYVPLFGSQLEMLVKQNQCTRKLCWGVMSGIFLMS